MNHSVHCIFYILFKHLLCNTKTCILSAVCNLFKRLLINTKVAVAPSSNNFKFFRLHHLHGNYIFGTATILSSSGMSERRKRNWWRIFCEVVKELRKSATMHRVLAKDSTAHKVSFLKKLWKPNGNRGRKSKLVPRPQFHPHKSPEMDAIYPVLLLKGLEVLIPDLCQIHRILQLNCKR